MWVECNSSTFEDYCDTIHIRSSPGAYGFYPWIDRTRNYYGILATEDADGIGGALFVQSMRADIDAALSANMSPSTSIIAPTATDTPPNNYPIPLSSNSFSYRINVLECTIWICALLWRRIIEAINF